jgi:hypothetical protein
MAKVKAPQTMAERHSAEINQIIAACHAGIARLKPFANWRKGKKPQGWTLARGMQAKAAIKKAFAQCSADMKAAVKRQRAEANGGNVAVTLAAPAGARPRPSRVKSERAQANAY